MAPPMAIPTIPGKFAVSSVFHPRGRNPHRRCAASCRGGGRRETRDDGQAFRSSLFAEDSASVVFALGRPPSTHPRLLLGFRQMELQSGRSGSCGRFLAAGPVRGRAFAGAPRSACASPPKRYSETVPRSVGLEDLSVHVHLGRSRWGTTLPSPAGPRVPGALFMRLQSGRSETRSPGRRSLGGPNGAKRPELRALEGRDA